LLGQLTEENREVAGHAKKYYGMYLLLVQCIDRMQERYIQEVEQVSIPKLARFEQEARNHITETRQLIQRDGPHELLSKNIETDKTTVEVCQVFADTLRKQKDRIAAENKQIKTMINVAANTYKTMSISMNVAKLISDSQRAFDAVKGIPPPPLRAFQGLQLKEFRHITDRMLEAKK
jgi:hypothetical protein